jgi:hypothetical protein
MLTNGIWFLLFSLAGQPQASNRQAGSERTAAVVRFVK